ncbi:MAG TPA: 2,3-bisphosphoglycerate-independent phosphoglycerate mutase [Alphaproteobacteria bacterium]
MTAFAGTRPVVLCILDGWGVRRAADDNAIELADTPTWDRLWAGCPHARIDASAGEVGLPAGQMGNSEVGHMNIGAGRVVMQDLPRIDAALADGSLARAPALARLIDRLKATGGACHLLGLMSPGGVHSHQRHIAALARTVAAAGVPVRVHAFLDGRDTPPRSGRDYLARFDADLAGAGGVAVATVGGRYYAMDRDRRWERTGRAYRVLVDAAGEHAQSAVAAVEASYAAGIGDEFVAPVAIAGYGGMADRDGLVMANFRADRVRQILAALLDPEFGGFARARTVAFAAALGMVSYSARLDRFLDVIFPPLALTDTLGEVVARAGLRQLRLAETEKYAHVTYFLNGGREETFDGEERILVPSPKVATYDLKPEMSAFEVTDRLVEAVAAGRHELIVVNYANTDMVGHTGKLAAAIAAVEAVDACLGRLVEAVTAAGGALLITADHGNAEQMSDRASGQAHTAHTTNPVPVVLVGGPAGARLDHGRLADIAPTVLELLGLARPAAMTGRSLIAGAGQAAAGRAAE